MSDPIPTTIPVAPEPAADEAAGARTPESVILELQNALAEAQAKASEHHDAFLRAKAETDNTRRRAAEDVSKAHKFGVERFAEAMLAVKDSLDAALVAENPTVETLRTGIELTSRQLASAFDKFSISEISPAGEKFDPNRHQAISSVESDAAPNTVVTVLQKGFALHDRVLRPALVVVAKAGSAENS
jgi:molecular chaperone GrpE